MLTITTIPNEDVCPFCQGTGISEYVDLEELKDMPDGSYFLNDLPRHVSTCPDCIKDN